MKRAGLVLEGGANRGVFTSGALDYLMEQDFYIPYVVGTSAGACSHCVQRTVPLLRIRRSVI